MQVNRSLISVCANICAVFCQIIGDHKVSQNNEILTLIHGSRISLAEGSEGCQFTSALANLCLSGA